MRPDPKLGWHTLWITPLACMAVSIAFPCRWMVDRMRSRLHKRRIRAILRDNPDIRDLSRLSGIEEDE